MSTAYRLYYAPDNASLIIRLALEEIGAPYTCVLIDRAVSAQRAPAYLAVNPTGKIPALETPDGIITETGAILLWLSDRHRQMGAAPDSPGRGLFLRWLFFVANTLHPDLAMSFYLHRFVSPACSDDARARTQTRLRDHLHLLNTAAGAANVPGLNGEQPGVIDCYVAACLRWSALYPQDHTGWFDLNTYPALRDLAGRLEARPAALRVAEAEGLGPTPFTNPTYANPSEGVAL